MCYRKLALIDYIAISLQRKQQNNGKLASLPYQCPIITDFSNILRFEYKTWNIFHLFPFWFSLIQSSCHRFKESSQSGVERKGWSHCAACDKQMCWQSKRGARLHFTPTDEYLDETNVLVDRRHCLGWKSWNYSSWVCRRVLIEVISNCQRLPATVLMSYSREKKKKWWNEVFGQSKLLICDKLWCYFWQAARLMQQNINFYQV